MIGGIVLCFLSLWLFMLQKSEYVFAAVLSALFGIGLLCFTYSVQFDLESRVLTIHIGPIWLRPKNIPFTQITHIEIEQDTYHTRHSSGTTYRARLCYELGSLNLSSFSRLADAKAHCSWIAGSVGCPIKPGPKLKELRDIMSDFE